MTIPPSARAATRDPWSSLIARWVLLLVVIGGGWYAVHWLLKTTPTAVYRVTVERIYAPNSQELTVDARITNISKISGTPTCTYDVSASGNSNNGVGVATLNGKIAPHASVVVPETVTGNAAKDVLLSGVSVGCS